MYQALYRKWRPRSFDDVVGQPAITNMLKKQVASDRLSHSYLFVGTRGTGKTTCAKILARAVNCENPVNGNPCNCCPACRGIEEGGVMDVVEIDAASNNGVDNVRALRDEAVYTPAAVKKRVYIIDEVHMLSTSAFNALLKIMEEPPEHLMFILCTTEIRKVLPTIVSRCQRYNFRRLSVQDIAGRLQYVAEQEQLKLEPAAAELLARLADGGMRDGLSLLDQCIGDDVITEETVNSVMGLAGAKQTAELLNAVRAGNTAKALTIFDTLWREGKDPANILNELGSLLRDILITIVAPAGGETLLTGAYPMKTLKFFTQKMSAPELTEALTTIEKADTAGSDPRRAAELCLVRLCVPDCGEDLRALRSRVNRLEKTLQSGVVPRPISVPEELPPEATEPLQHREKARPVEMPEEAPPKELPPEPEEWAPPPPEDDWAPPEPGLCEREAPRVEYELDPDPDPEPGAVFTTPVIPAGSKPGDLSALLLERLNGMLLPYLCQRLFPSAGTVMDFEPEQLVIHVSSPFDMMQLNTPDITEIIRKAATEVAGRNLKVIVTDEPAEQRQPNEEKLAQLARFSNFTVE